MNKRIQLFCAFVLPAALAAGCASAKFKPPQLAGETFIHDPSSIVKDRGRYYVLGTGLGIRVKSSPDLVHWTDEWPLLDSPPAWTFRDVPGFTGYSLWAPDIIRMNGTDYVYYAVSTFGKHVSAIGLATIRTLDPSDTNIVWQDCGPVIESKTNSPFNAIDPSVFLDNDGKLWLAFGSFWKGIYLAELDPRTGRRISTNSPLSRLAWHKTIEAACLTRHGDFYYLFVNWGECCKGVNSTYEVRIGRAEKITGPYLDRAGRKLLNGGGTKFLSSSGRFIGPGHIGIVDDDGTSGTTLFSYHYYDAETYGRSRLAIGRIDWSSGWPVAVK